jgi:hypothetical protein
MIRIVRASDGEIIGLIEAAGIEADAYSTVDDAVERLLSAQASGAIEIEPTGAELQRMMIRAEVQRTMRSEIAEDGIRQYAVDRKGGRLNRTAARVVAYDAARQQDMIRSIYQYMLIEGPAAYRSQAELLGSLDPSANVERTAAEASRAVHEAVRGGFEDGKSGGTRTEDVA